MVPPWRLLVIAAGLALIGCTSQQKPQNAKVPERLLLGESTLADPMSLPEAPTIGAVDRVRSGRASN